MKTIIFDIETGPVEQEELIKMMPEFDAPANYSKPESIQKYIEAKKEEYLSGTTAPLHATTGKILAIGYCEYNTDTKERSDIKFLEGDEIDILNNIWIIFNNADCVIGFNSNYFDIPFIMRRSWKLGVKSPTLFNMMLNNRYLDNAKYIDLINIWGAGTPQKIKLDYLAKFLDVGGKNGDGSMFAEIYSTNKQKALDYLKNDVEITFKCAEKMLGW